VRRLRPGSTPRSRESLDARQEQRRGVRARERLVAKLPFQVAMTEAGPVAVLAQLLGSPADPASAAREENARPLM